MLENMTILPDIIREAKIVSGKDQMNTLPATNITSYDLVNESSEFRREDPNNNSKIFIKKKTLNASDSEQSLPTLIFNDKNRSSSYQRLGQSTDFLNVKNSPLATKLIYNWKPVERLPTKVVQAKVKIYKPAKRIEMPARPPSPYKVQTHYETSEPHFHNEKEVLK